MQVQSLERHGALLRQLCNIVCNALLGAQMQQLHWMHRSSPVHASTSSDPHPHADINTHSPTHCPPPSSFPIHPCFVSPPGLERSLHTCMKTSTSANEHEQRGKGRASERSEQWGDQVKRASERSTAREPTRERATEASERGSERSLARERESNRGSKAGSERGGEGALMQCCCPGGVVCMSRE